MSDHDVRSLERQASLGDERAREALEAERDRLDPMRVVVRPLEARLVALLRRAHETSGEPFVGPQPKLHLDAVREAVRHALVDMVFGWRSVVRHAWRKAPHLGAVSLGWERIYALAVLDDELDDQRLAVGVARVRVPTNAPLDDARAISDLVHVWPSLKTAAALGNEARYNPDARNAFRLMLCEWGGDVTASPKSKAVRVPAEVARAWVERGS